MTVACDRVVTAQCETRRPGDPEQRVDRRFCLERVRGIEPPLRAWEPLSGGLAARQPVRLRRVDLQFRGVRVSASGPP
jgi:hypothetical protein